MALDVPAVSHRPGERDVAPDMCRKAPRRSRRADVAVLGDSERRQGPAKGP
jgi:hypothetical protein